MFSQEQSVNVRTSGRQTDNLVRHCTRSDSTRTIRSIPITFNKLNQMLGAERQGKMAHGNLPVLLGLGCCHRGGWQQDCVCHQSEISRAQQW